MGKRKKEHKKRVAKRNERIKQSQKKFEKLKSQFIQQIMKEREEGKFNEENLTQLPNQNPIQLPNQ